MGSLVGLCKGGSARYHDGRCDHHQGEKLGAGRDLGCVGRQAELKRNMVLLKATSTAPPAVVRSQGEAVPGSLLLGGVTRYLTAGDGDGSCAKDGPECGRRHRGATNLKGPSFLPG